MAPGEPLRRAGILIPLFSMPSSTSWGIGEIHDIGRIARWLEAAGIGLLQLLPINELPSGETSPYSALSAMAIDPQFITMERVEDFAAIGGEPQLESALRGRLDVVRSSLGINYAEVRDLKHTVLRRAFQHFRDTEWTGDSKRAASLRAYIGDQAWWLDEYALFRALHARHGERPWSEWPEPLQGRQPDALAAARDELADDILYRQYLQWTADEQWAAARHEAGAIALFGDLPFMVGRDSADVWARQDEFRFDASVGVPPDAFSETGQDWGLPVYRWDVVAERDFDWLRDRARRNAALFDGYRVDHLVGFYRTYFRPHDGGEPQCTPSDPAAQTKLGEEVLQVLRLPGAEIVAEDLGLVPDFVRDSLARLDIPGYKVLRWERHWRMDQQPFRDPAEYPPVAVATSGTHDTEPMATWWGAAPRDEKEAVLDIPSVRARLTREERAALPDAAGMPDRVRHALLEVLFESGASLLILPIQDVFGWRDRINQPATVSPTNWVWRLPWPVDRLLAERLAVDVAAQLKAWSRKSGRSR